MKKLPLTSNLMNERTEVEMYVMQKVLIRRCHPADMTWNLFQVWMTVWLFVERAHFQSSVMQDRIYHN